MDEHGRWVSGEKLTQEIDKIFEICASRGSGQDVACDTRLSLRDPWGRAAASVVGPLEVGVDIDQVSTRDLNVIRRELDDHFVPDGLGTFVESFGHGVPIEHPTPVSSVAWSREAGVGVTADGKVYRCRSALVTVSTGVLAKDTIRFQPSLPEWKVNAIHNLPMGNDDKIALTFSENVFPEVKPSTRLRRIAHPEAPTDFVLRPMGAPIGIEAGAANLHPERRLRRGGVAVGRPPRL